MVFRIVYRFVCSSFGVNWLIMRFTYGGYLNFESNFETRTYKFTKVNESKELRNQIWIFNWTPEFWKFTLQPQVRFTRSAPLIDLLNKWRAFFSPKIVIRISSYCFHKVHPPLATDSNDDLRSESEQFKLRLNGAVKMCRLNVPFVSRIYWKFQFRNLTTMNRLKLRKAKPKSGPFSVISKTDSVY